MWRHASAVLVSRLEHQAVYIYRDSRPPRTEENQVFLLPYATTLGTRGCVVWISQVKKEGWNHNCEVLVAYSTSISSRPVAMAYLTVARTASMFGAHGSRSDGAFPPK
jgi:hypothetical protein